MPKPSHPADEDAFDSATLEQARLLFARECTFLKGVVSIATLPEPDRPEIAFVCPARLHGAPARIRHGVRGAQQSAFRCM